MKLYYAHYPALVRRFIRFVRQNRQSPVDKWLIICASSWMAQRLQAQLAREDGALANIHFITGSSLVGRLDEETPGEKLPLLPQDHVRDFLIKEILSEPGLNQYPLSRGFVQAVKSSLRDLADSMADPAVLEEHLLSLPDYILQEDGARFHWLVSLYKRYCERENNVPGYRSYQTAFENALAQVETSPYLHEFSHIVIYGFYDMPGRQLELLSRVRATYPVTVFAPYEKHPAYAFAKKFFETNWLSVPGAEAVEEKPSNALGASAAYLFTGSGHCSVNKVEIISAPTSQGAVFYAVKEIVKRQQAGQPLADMALVVRSLPAYQDEIRQVCKDNCISLDASFSYPLTKYALGTCCLNLLGLAANGFARENVVSLFSSPYFKHPHKYVWRRLVSRSLVKRDLSQWQDLLPQVEGFEPALLQWVEDTAAELDQLNRPQSWSVGVARVRDFLDKHIDATAFQGKDAEIYASMQEAISKMGVYVALRPQSKEGELIKEVVEALSALTFNEVEAVRGGLTVTDAVRARGLQFKTVFLLGMNDQEFPLVMPEDPILRDYYRFHLRDTLGYWINASLDRGDEEKLLFYNAVTLAQEKLYVLYNRYDAEGKPAVPSVYVAELARVCELNLQAADAPRVSGRLLERLRACDEYTLTPKELSYRLILEEPTPATAYQQAGLLDDAKTRSLAAASKLAQTGPLCTYDGLIASGLEIFTRENTRGFSPSALQELAACPLKYFLNRGLHLGEPDEPASRHALPADKQGTAYHEILKKFYQTLLTKDGLSNWLDEAMAQHMLHIISQYYTADSYRAFGIYPVVWEIILDHIRQRLTDFAVQDTHQLGALIPQYFEQEVTLHPTENLPIRLRGIMDRVDADPTHLQYRVADYKSTRKGTANLAKDFFTRLVFQPVLYIVMARALPLLKNYETAGSCLLSIDPYSKRDLSAGEFAAVWPRAVNLLIRLAELVKTGTFLMCPGDTCKYCPYQLLCRKDAFKPLLRAQKSAQYTSLEEARRYDA